MNWWASPARSNGNASATIGSRPPSSICSTSGPVIRSMLPSVSHQASMLRPNTPLFSFITCRLFHQGMVAVGMRARLPISFGMLRPVSVGGLGEPVHDQPPALAQDPVALAEAPRPLRVEDHVHALARR